MNSKGLIIYFDGPDGVGKTTQLKLAAEALRQAGHDVYETRTMGGTPIGEELRKVFLSGNERPPEADLHIALAAQHILAEDVRQRRERGQIVFIDRSPLSIIGYQVYGDGIDRAQGEAAVQELLDLIEPDLIINYLAPDEQLQARRKERNHNTGSDFFEDKPPEYHQAVAKGFNEAASRFGAQVVNAAKTPDVVHETTMALIRPLL